MERLVFITKKNRSTTFFKDTLIMPKKKSLEVLTIPVEECNGIYTVQKVSTLYLSQVLLFEAPETKKGRKVGVPPILSLRLCDKSQSRQYLWKIQKPRAITARETVTLY